MEPNKRSCLIDTPQESLPPNSFLMRVELSYILFCFFATIRQNHDIFPPALHAMTLSVIVLGFVFFKRGKLAVTHFNSIKIKREAQSVFRVLWLQLKTPAPF